MRDGLASVRLGILGQVMKDYIDRANRRKPPEDGLAAPAVSPRGPLPLEGGAEAPLD
jgi:hypothetical protein